MCEAARDVLKDSVFHLITILVDSRLNGLEDGQQVTQSAVEQLIEKSDSTNIMRSDQSPCLSSCIHHIFIGYTAAIPLCKQATGWVSGVSAIPYSLTDGVVLYYT